jgi:hypothetical protein
MKFNYMYIHYVLSYCVYTVHAHLWWFHVEDLGDPPLHDQEVRIVDIQLNRAKEVLDSRGRGITAIDQILVASTNHNLKGNDETRVAEHVTTLYLSGNDYFIIGLIANRALLLVVIVEGDCYRGLGHSGLTSLVHQLLKTTSTDLWTPSR